MMEYDVDSSQVSCLQNTVAAYIARCKHGLHDDSLIEHYENVYQNNILYYNKILCLLRGTLDVQKKNSERIRSVIDNDLDLKEGINHEIEKLQKKCNNALLHLERLKQEEDEARSVLSETECKLRMLEDGLTLLNDENKTKRDQLRLFFYVLANVKSAASRIRTRVDRGLRYIAIKRKCIIVLRNAHRLCLAHLEDLTHLGSNKLDYLNKLSKELAEEKANENTRQLSIVRKTEELLAEMSTLNERKLNTEVAVAALVEEIKHRKSDLIRLKNELATLKENVSTQEALLLAATEAKKRLTEQENCMSTKITQLKKTINTIDSECFSTKTHVEEKQNELSKLEVAYRKRSSDLDRQRAQINKAIATCNSLRLQRDDMLNTFVLKFSPELMIATNVHAQTANHKTRNMGFQELQKVESFLCRRETELKRREEEIKESIESATTELRSTISKNELLSKEIEDTAKRSQKLKEENAGLLLELTQLTSREDQRVQMRLDLRNERDYINKSIAALNASEDAKKQEHNRQIQEEIETHKKRLQQLKNDDLSDFADIVDEETKNSNILLNAATESLQVEHAQEKSQLEAKYNAMIQEEIEKFEAIMKVNANDIAQLRKKIEETKRSKKESTISQTPSTAPILQEKPTKIPIPKDANVCFKKPSMLKPQERQIPSALVKLSSSGVHNGQPEIKKEIRRKCIRRTASKDPKSQSDNKDELDLFC